MTGFEITNKTVSVDGNDVEVANKDDLVKAIQNGMRSAGLSKAKVFIEGTEIASPASINYDTINDGDEIELKPYDKAASEECGWVL